MELWSHHISLVSTALTRMMEIERGMRNEQEGIASDGLQDAATKVLIYNPVPTRSSLPYPTWFGPRDPRHGCLRYGSLIIVPKILHALGRRDKPRS